MTHEQVNESDEAPVVTLTPVPRRSGAGRVFLFLTVIILSILSAAAVVITKPLWEPLTAGWIAEPKREPDPELVDWLQRLGQRQVEMQTKIESLPDPATDFDVRIAPIKNGIAETNRQIDSLRSALQAPQANADIDSLRARVGALEQNLEALAQKLQLVPSGDSSDSAFVTASAARLAQLEQAEVLIKAKLDDVQAEQMALKQQIAALETRAQPAVTPGAENAPEDAGNLLLLGTVWLKLAAEEGAPLTTGINLLTASTQQADTDKAAIEKILASLQPWAGESVPTRAMLAAQLEALSIEIARSGNIISDQEANSSWWGDLADSFASLIEIRPAASPQGADPASIMARAQTQLRAGNLAGAVREISTLPDPALSQAAAWRKAAEARLGLEAALEQLDELVARRLAARAGTRDQ